MNDKKALLDAILMPASSEKVRGDFVDINTAKAEAAAHCNGQCVSPGGCQG